MMLNNRENPVAWPLLLMQLDEARNHFEDLIERMTSDGAIDETDFAIDLGHIYAHLNRAWHGRNDANLDQWNQEKHERCSQFPSDLTPMG